MHQLLRHLRTVRVPAAIADGVVASSASATFEGQSLDLGWGRVFGGQIVGQGLHAAAQTVTTDTHSLHSVHTHFLRPGKVTEPIQYVTIFTCSWYHSR